VPASGGGGRGAGEGRPGRSGGGDTGPARGGLALAWRRAVAAQGDRAIVEAVLGNAWRRADAGKGSCDRAMGGGDARRRRAGRRGPGATGRRATAAKGVGARWFRSMHCGLCGCRGE
jgi:hypothetical protein